ncbi:MAG: hypothetical protein AB7H66_09695 [Hyphomonadaceae bacterium]
MRVRAILAALLLVVAPAMLAPTAAYADGIERPRRPQPPRRRPPPPPAPVPPRAIETGPETVTLSNSFFAGSSGGVGADIGAGAYSSTTVIIRGGHASASAFAFASARASARGGGFGHGRGRWLRLPLG